MDVTHVGDAALGRTIERFEAQQEAQDGMIEYVACMADVDLPEDDEETEAAGDGE